MHHTENQNTELTDEQCERVVAVFTDGLLLKHDKVGQEMLNDVAHEICEFFINEMPNTYFHFGRRRGESVSIHGNVS